MNRPDYCFALKNGFCEALRDPRCPGYDVCPFYKPRSVWEAEWGESADECFSLRRRLEEGDKAEILKMREEGVKAPEIAEILGLNIKSVYHVFAKDNAARNPDRPRQPHKAITDEQKQKIAELRAEGLGAHRIGKALGMAKSTVFKIIHEQEGTK